jgi:ribosomal protein L37AE/L43A
MSPVRCPNCGLTISSRHSIAMQPCPRCLARGKGRWAMVDTTPPLSLVHAVAELPDARRPRRGAG